MEQYNAFNCSYNEFSGKFEANKSEWFIGNPRLCLETRQCRKPEDHRLKKEDFIHIFIILGSVFLITSVFVILTYLWVSMKKKKMAMLSSVPSEKKHLAPWNLILFHHISVTYKELIECLDEANIIGSGGGGEVYKATLKSGQEVAIKKLWEVGQGMDLQDHGFKAEVDSLGAIRHRNIVKLFCCCSYFSTNLLVYEYMPNGSLGDMLHSAKDNTLSDWNLRCKIAIGAAQGLAYLHHDCVPQILHRDIKSNNILLDKDYEAHIADFGLARYLDDVSVSMVAGSYGYIAPEYAYTLNVNEKSDVYSFGVVLLELITGRQPIATEFGDAMTIVTWVAKKIRENGQDNLVDLIDEKILDLKSYKSQILHVFHIANYCTQHVPKDRPTMKNISDMLLDIQKVDIHST